MTTRKCSGWLIFPTLLLGLGGTPGASRAAILLRPGGGPPHGTCDRAEMTPVRAEGRIRWSGLSVLVIVTDTGPDRPSRGLVDIDPSGADSGTTALDFAPRPGLTGPEPVLWSAAGDAATGAISTATAEGWFFALVANDGRFAWKPAVTAPGRWRWSARLGHPLFIGGVRQIRSEGTPSIPPPPVAVPEPDTLGMGGAGALMGLVFAWRHRRRKA